MSIKKKVITGVVVVAVLGVVWGIYQAKRSINYSLGYKKEVKATVCDMIKPEKWAEVLKNPEDCK